MKTIAIVVTFNRLEKLKKTLCAYDKIERGLDMLIIVDNNSSDGTDVFLKNWQKEKAFFDKKVLSLSENLGGSGGFYHGCKEAMNLGADWILVSDDDAYPDSAIMFEFNKFINENANRKISAVCSTVKHMDGTIDTGHRKKYSKKFAIRPLFTPVSLNNYVKPSFNIDLFSYVGTFLNAKALERVGLCNDKYFIYYDDTEHSMRMSTWGEQICVPSIIFSHDDGYGLAKEQKDILMTWRDYYDIRNKINMFLLHDKLVAFFWVISRLLMCFMKFPMNIECQKMYLTAIKDGLLGRLGKHSVYKPGFSIK